MNSQVGNFARDLEPTQLKGVTLGWGSWWVLKHSGGVGNMGFLTKLENFDQNIFSVVRSRTFEILTASVFCPSGSSIPTSVTYKEMCHNYHQRIIPWEITGRNEISIWHNGRLTWVKSTVPFTFLSDISFVLPFSMYLFYFPRCQFQLKGTEERPWQINLFSYSRKKSSRVALLSLWTKY